MASALTDLSGATRLARAIASDLWLYNNDAIDRSLREGRPFAGLDDELIEARHLFLRRVHARLDPVPLLVSTLQAMSVRLAAQQGLPTDGIAEALAARLDRGADRLALLVVDGHPDVGRVIPLADGVQDVGREHTADIRIADPTLSRSHARFIVDGARVVIEDAESTCGITVNDRKVRSAPLVVGDRLRLGVVDVTLIRVGAVEPAIDPSHGSREAPEHVDQRKLVLDALGSALRRRGPLALVLCVLDDRDRIGERAGDGEAVRTIVDARLGAAARALQGAALGRHGEGFLVVLPGEEAAVRAHAEALRREATGERVVVGHTQAEVSLSITVTPRLDTDPTGPEALLERAWANASVARSPVRVRG